MKKLAIFPVIFSSLLVSTAVYANSDFAVRQAKKIGFNGCDTQIRKVFANSASKGDERINSSYLVETKKDTIRLTSTSGVPGDSFYIDSQIRKQAGMCLSMTTIILSFAESCATQQKENPAFKVKYQVADFTWSENSGGLMQFMRSIGTGCMVIYHVSDTGAGDHVK